MTNTSAQPSTFSMGKSSRSKSFTNGSWQRIVYFFERTFATSKAAVARWVRRNALEPDWLDAGILLNAIARGMVATPMIQGVIDSPETRAEVEKFMPRPLRRDAQPREIAELLCWLASPASSMVVGQVIFADGGSELAVRGDTHW